MERFRQSANRTECPSTSLFITFWPRKERKSMVTDKKIFSRKTYTFEISGKACRVFRKYHRITQAQLSFFMMQVPSFVSDVERGRLKRIGAYAFHALLHTYGPSKLLDRIFTNPTLVIKCDGPALRRKRLKAGLTVKRFAELLGFSVRQVRNLEYCTNSEITMILAEKILVILK